MRADPSTAPATWRTATASRSSSSLAATAAAKARDRDRASGTVRPGPCDRDRATGTVRPGPCDRDRATGTVRPGLAVVVGRPTGEDGFVVRASTRRFAVLYAFGFERIGVLASDLYFVDPDPNPGQEGAERGVRLEVRMLSQGELKGSIYSARPIEVGAPIWRADLLEAADGPAGSLNRAHHHPAFEGWNPSKRVFDKNLSTDPVRWVGAQLSDLEALLSHAGVQADQALAADAQSLRDCVPEIMAVVRGLLDKVKAGQLARAPVGAAVAS